MKRAHTLAQSTQQNQVQLANGQAFLLNGTAAEVADLLVRLMAGASFVVNVNVFASPFPQDQAKAAIGTTSPVPPQPCRLEDIHEAKCRIDLLRLFVLMPWAWQQGARSMRTVKKELQNVPKIGPDIPASLSGFNLCVTCLTQIFKQFFGMAASEPLELFLRHGHERPKPPDTRAYIGLTEIGWRAWHYARIDLEKRDPEYKHYAHLVAAIRPGPERTNAC
jgi:hypothetical protein